MIQNYNLTMNMQAYDVNFDAIRCFKMLSFNNHDLGCDIIWLHPAQYKKMYI